MIIIIIFSNARTMILCKMYTYNTLLCAHYLRVYNY